MELIARITTYSAWTLGETSIFWVPAVAWLIYATATRDRTSTAPRVTELWLLFLGPILILFWGALAYGWGEGAEGRSWPFRVLDALTIGQFIAVVIVLYRQRQRFELAFACALGAVCLSGYGWFVGAMSIANDWI